MSIDWRVVNHTEPPQDEGSRAHRLEDKAAVREAIHRWMTLVDQRSWQEVQKCFDDRVYVDYTELRPEPPAGWFEAGTMVAGWKARYDSIIAYQHHVGNFIDAIAGDTARAAASPRTIVALQTA